MITLTNDEVGWDYPSFPNCPALMPHALKAVICCVQAPHPSWRLFEACRWSAKGQKDIVVREELPLLGAGDRRMNVAAWLQSLGLERYESLFRDNEIDWEVLPKLTSEDLKEIGVVAIGHRRKLLDAIAALGAVRSQT